MRRVSITLPSVRTQDGSFEVEIHDGIFVVTWHGLNTLGSLGSYFESVCDLPAFLCRRGTLHDVRDTSFDLNAEGLDFARDYYRVNVSDISGHRPIATLSATPLLTAQMHQYFMTLGISETSLVTYDRTEALTYVGLEQDYILPADRTSA